MDLLDILDLNLAPGVRDHPRALKSYRDLGDAGAADTHHLRQELLREKQFVADELLHPEKPFAGPRLHLVHGVACGGLLYLREEKLIIGHHRFAESRME